MRGLALFPVLLCAAASAQNWALMNPAYKYNYSNDGTDTISNQIFVTHIDTLGVDSFRYELNTTAAQCDTCSGPELFLWTNSPQFLQREVNTGNGTWHFHDPGSFVLLPSAPVAASWIFDTLANVQATITAIDTVDQFGVDVPRKIVSLSNGETLTLSEQYGILGWGYDSLLGVHGPEVGELIPTIAQFFPYQPGDQVEYKKDYGNCCPFNGENTCFKLTFSGAVASDTAIAFSGTKVAYTHIYTHYDFNGPVYHTYIYQNGPDIWTAGSSELPFFDLVRSYPGQLVATRTWGSEGQACVAWHGMDSLGRYQIRCTLPGPSQFIHPQSTSTEGLVQAFPEEFCMDDEQNCEAVYTEGIGLVRYGVNFFETGLDYNLDGAVIAGDTLWTLSTDDQILAVNDGSSQRVALLYPNPASERIWLTNLTTGSRVRITDPDGRLVASHLLTTGNGPINVQNLQAGAYLLAVDGLTPQRFIIVR